ncbi:MAG: putative DNA binding domain-containing protein [Isosphaeraceae bacterium]
MNRLVAQIEEWIRGKEDETCEFKEAKQRYDFEELVKYGAGLANCGGGRIILGVTDLRPRRVVGTQAFDQPERTRNGLRERLRLRVDFDEVSHPDGRVLVFHVPSRPVGTPIGDRGVYWTRHGDSLAGMSEEQLRGVFAEAGRDFTAQPCPAAGLSDLDGRAVEDFRRRWVARSGNSALSALSHEQLLTDAGVLLDGQVTYASLILFGTHQALGRHLPQAEVTFEYRSDNAIAPQSRRNPSA